MKILRWYLILIIEYLLHCNFLLLRSAYSFYSYTGLYCKIIPVLAAFIIIYVLIILSLIYKRISGLYIIRICLILEFAGYILSFFNSGLWHHLPEGTSNTILFIVNCINFIILCILLIRNKKGIIRNSEAEINFNKDEILDS
jgi:hypothetical protein